MGRLLAIMTIVPIKLTVNQILHLVWHRLEAAIDWWILQDDEYIPLVSDEPRLIRSQMFSGLWLSIPAMLSGEMALVLSHLQAGINSPAHQVFKQEL
ncbi:MAG: hypothetical protein MUF72_23875 [Elainella sp. Prado103]|nr:hypothetical protein [Elainella sp. Prado103]